MALECFGREVVFFFFVFFSEVVNEEDNEDDEKKERKESSEGMGNKDGYLILPLMETYAY